MSQIDSWYEDDTGHYTIVTCPRKDCNIAAKAYSVDGPWRLLPEAAYLLEQGKDGSAVVYDFPGKREV